MHDRLNDRPWTGREKKNKRVFSPWFSSRDATPRLETRGELSPGDVSQWENRGEGTSRMLGREGTQAHQIHTDILLNAALFM